MLRDPKSFFSATPKELFNQFKIYKKVNGIEEENKTKNGVVKGNIDDFMF